MTEAGTIAPTPVKPYSPDENPGAPEMDRVAPTPVAGMQPRPAFGATDPDAVQAAPFTPPPRTDPPSMFTPTPIDAEPTKTVDLSSDGAKNVENQDKASDQAKKDEANNEPKNTGPDFAAIKERAQADAENRNRDMKAAQSDMPDAKGRMIFDATGSNQRGLSGSAGGYAEPTPSVGRIVLYTLSQADADRINTRRVYGAKGQDGSALEEGASVQAGTQYPAMITNVGDGKVNLHVIADGNHGVWVENATKGTEGGNWAWPVVR